MTVGKHIVIVSAVFPPEPVFSAKLSSDLAIRLAKSTPVIVISPKPSRPYGYDFNGIQQRNFEFEHIIVKSFVCPQSRFLGRLFESFSFGRKTAKYIKINKENISCLYMNTWPLFSQWLTVRECKRHSLPCIVHVQDIYPETLYNRVPLIKPFLGWVLDGVDRYSLRNASRVITISPNMKEYLSHSRNLNSSNIDLVYNWAEEEKIQQSGVKEKKDVFTFMFLGSLSPTASLGDIIRAFGKSKIDDARLVIAGNGSEKRNLVEIANHYKHARIEFREANPEEVFLIQEEADVLILSLKQGTAKFALPSKLANYMYSGKPILSFVDEGSDVDRIIRQSRCGWVSLPGDLDGMSESMKTTRSIPSKQLSVFGRSGLAFAREHFSMETNLEFLSAKLLEYS